MIVPALPQKAIQVVHTKRTRTIVTIDIITSGKIIREADPAAKAIMENESTNPDIGC
jgi:hypothetical protein